MNKVNHNENGYSVECTQDGQNRPYGDGFKKFIVKTDKPEAEVLAYCTEHIKKCNLTTEEYLADEKAGVKDFGDHFRRHYKLRKIKEGEYFYQVTRPSTC